MDTSRINKTINRWRDFAKRNGISLNSDSRRVELLASGILSNEDNYGYKYCPCRLNTGDEVVDTKFICPCNFKAQKTWKEMGECWCSLFVKK